MTLSVVEDVGCPYPGLRPFRRDESCIFFGREEQVDDLLRKLQEGRFVAVVGVSGCGKSSLVLAGLIAGLEAGLLGKGRISWRIATMHPAGQPMRELARSLVQDDALGPLLPPPLLLAALNRGPLGLIEILQGSRPDGSPVLADGENLLLVIDQFEEIFRFRRTGEAQADAPSVDEGSPGQPDRSSACGLREAIRCEADAFVALILETIRQASTPGGPAVYTVLTMRSDYLGDCALFPGLPEALNDRQFLTPRLSREQRRASIEGPAAVGGARVEPALVARLLNEMGAAPDQLPLMQHVLMRLWLEAEKTRPREADAKAVEPIELRESDYEALGGIVGALDRQAQGVYDAMSKSEQRITERLFRLLGERGPDGRDTRRLAKVAEVAAVAEASEGEVLALIDRFRAPDLSFLELSGDVVDVTHESVLRQWRLVQRWLSLEAEEADLYRQLRLAAIRFDRDLRDKGEGDLLGPQMTATALAWRDGKRGPAGTWRPNAAWSERYGDREAFHRVVAFIRDSEVDVNRQRAHNRLSQRVRTLLLAAIGAGVVLFGFSMRLVSQQAKLQTSLAKNKEINAELGSRERQLQQKNLTAASLNALSENAPVRALLLAVEAVRRSKKLDGSFATIADDTLRRVLMKMGGRPLIGHDAAVTEVAADPLGRWAVTASRDATARIWDLSEVRAAETGGPRVPGPRQLVLPHDSAVARLAVSPDGNWLATRSERHSVRLFDLRAGLDFDRPAPAPCQSLGDDATTKAFDFSPKGRWFLSFGTNYEVRLADLKAAGVPPRLVPLASGRESIAPLRAILSSVADHVVPQSSQRESIAGWAFSPDDRWLGLVTMSGRFELWELDGPTPVRRPVSAPLSAPVVQTCTICFSSDSRRLTAGLLSGNVLMLDLEANPRQVHRHPLHRNVPAEARDQASRRPPSPIIATSVDGRWAVTARDPAEESDPPVLEGTAVLWDFGSPGPRESHHLLADFPDWLEAPEICVFDDRYVVARAGGGTVLVWDLSVPRPLHTPITLTGHVGPVRLLTYNADRGQLFTSCDDDTVRIWNLASANPGAGPTLLRGHDRKVNAIALAPRDGANLLITASEDSSVRLWNLASFPNGLSAEPRVLRNLSGWNSVLVTPRRDWLIAAMDGSGPRLWDLRHLGDALPTPRELREIEGKITSFIPAADGRWVVANLATPITRGDIDPEQMGRRSWLLDLDDPRSGPRQLKGITGKVVTFQVSPDGRWLACTTSFDGRPNSLRAASYLVDLTKPGATARPIAQNGSQALAISDDSRWLVLDTAAECHVMDLKAVGSAAPPIRSLRGYDGSALPPLFSPGSRHLAIASRLRGIHLWTRGPAGGHLERSLFLPCGRSLMREYRFDPLGKRLIATDFESIVRVWKLEGLGRSLHMPELTRPAPKLMAISKDGRRLAIAENREIQVWDLSADQLAARRLAMPTDHDPSARSEAQDLSALAFSTDGRRLVAFAGREAAAWNVGDMSRPPIAFGGHGGSMVRADLSQDRFLAITSLDDSVRIWDLRGTGPLTNPTILRPREGNVVATVVGPSGRSALTVSSGVENTASLWSLDVGKMIDAAAAIAGRNLTAAEWKQFLPPLEDYRRTFPDLPVPPDSVFQNPRPTSPGMVPTIGSGVDRY